MNETETTDVDHVVAFLFGKEEFNLLDGPPNSKVCFPEPVVVRCNVERPADLRDSAQILCSQKRKDSVFHDERESRFLVVDLLHEIRVIIFGRVNTCFSIFGLLLTSS